MSTFSIPTNVRAICFDAVGTLIYPFPNAAEVYAEVGKTFGTRYVLSEIKERFAKAFGVQEEADEVSGWSTNVHREEARWRQIVSDVFDDVSSGEACFQKLWSHFADPRAWAVFDDVAATIRSLADVGYVLGLASNFDARLRGVVAGHPPLEDIAHLFISAEVGWRKPHSQFFRHVCESLGLEAENILFVGDDRTNDLEGATASGMPAVLISRDGRNQGVRSLTELCPAGN